MIPCAKKLKAIGENGDTSTFHSENEPAALKTKHFQDIVNILSTSNNEPKIKLTLLLLRNIMYT
jgi:hypothetical protein